MLIWGGAFPDTPYKTMKQLRDTETHKTVGWFVRGHVEEMPVEGELKHTRFRNVPSKDSPTGRQLREVDDEKPGSFRVTVIYS